jgi:hypothetical protein
VLNFLFKLGLARPAPSQPDGRHPLDGGGRQMNPGGEPPDLLLGAHFEVEHSCVWPSALLIAKQQHSPDAEALAGDVPWFVVSVAAVSSRRDSLRCTRSANSSHRYANP